MLIMSKDRQQRGRCDPTAELGAYCGLGKSAVGSLLFIVARQKTPVNLTSPKNTNLPAVPKLFPFGWEVYAGLMPAFGDVAPPGRPPFAQAWRFISFPFRLVLHA